ncbi:telomere length regulation protein-domain-containing protein [Absidia repens]|uniref:Telomere length regulation protein-domain-containing protein n=1 Tax=Absidia repens TaxID=90262 RepID=A0A1X2ILR4_9FUNG|nr:telomere length regulation protein-domain-containing protein [Absidia repens]
MDSLETLRLEIEHLDDTIQSSNDTTIESVRESLHRPLARLSPGLIKNTIWERHIWMLLHTMIPRWAFILTTTTEDREALIASLIGSSSCSEQLRSVMAQSSLPLLLECIREHNISSTTTSMDVLDLYTSLLKHFCSTTMMATYLRQAAGFTDRLSFCSLLCSIPSRLSNAYGLHQVYSDNDTLELGQPWYSDSRFYSTLTKHITVQVGLLCEYQKDDMKLDETMLEGVGMASELIGKMTRQGFHNTCLETIIPIAIQHNATHDSKNCSLVWDRLWTLCENEAPADKVYSAILDYLNKHVDTLRQQRTSSSNNDISPSSIRSSIKSMASTLSPILFTSTPSSRSASDVRIQNFLAYTLKDTSKIRLADDLVLRTIMAMVVHSTGLEPLEMDEVTDDRAWKLSLRTTNIVEQYLRNVIECWTDPVLIKQTSDSERRYMTTLLLVLFGYADSDMMEEMEYSTGILQGISTWFSTSDEATAKLAMIVAESMSLRTKNKDGAVLDFGIPMNQQLKDLKELALVADGLTKAVDDSSLILLPKNGSSADDDTDDDSDADLLGDGDQYLDPDVLIAPDDEDDEETSDLEPYPMEEESDDDENGGENADPKKKKARIPVYVSELVAYLKDQEDPEKLEIGLNAAEQIIRQNTNIGTGIAEWAIDIGKRLIYFPETYDIDNYWKLQQSALAALIVACPDKITGFVIEEFFSQNTSIGQKNVIMATISMAVLELSGWNSYSDKKNDKDVNLNMDMLDMVAPSINELAKPSKSGQLVFSSSRAQVEQKRQKGIVRNRLSGLAGPVFFFPLVIGWWEASQTRLRWMAQDPMLVERFIMTLNVIMQCASNTPDRKKIVKEYFDYALSLRYIPRLSSRILRALLLGVNTILHICYKNQTYLVLTEYTLELAGIEKWLEDILEMQQQDKELQQLAITLLVSIGQMSKMGPY